MCCHPRCSAALAVLFVAVVATALPCLSRDTASSFDSAVAVARDAAHDVSAPLGSVAGAPVDDVCCDPKPGAIEPGAATGAMGTRQKEPLTSASVEQTAQGSLPPPEIVASFDGLGVGFEGPQGTTKLGNPSDNSLAVGPDHIMQTVNT